MLQRSNPMPLVLAVADPEHEQPDWQEQHGELHVGDLGHEEDDAGQENQCEIVRPRVEDGVKFRLLVVQAAVTAELQVCDTDDHPADDSGARRNHHEVHEDMALQEVVERDDDERDARRDENAAHGHAARRELAEERRGLARARQAVEHAAVAVDGRVVDRDGCCQHDKVQDVRGGRDADVVEDLDERTRLHADLVPRPEGHEDDHRADIENQDAPDDLIDGTRDRAVRIFGLTGRDADELDAAE